ncbi:MAG: hypothetical protein AMXMBFR53_36720 [Gemmatimonadota bacterium]
MDMRSFWSGFLAALSLVLLVWTVRLDYFTGRAVVAGIAMVCGLLAAGFSHDARRTP